MIIGGDRFQVRARAEGPVLTEQDPNTRFFVSIKFPERIRERLGRSSINGVADFGPA
jgi:hypothetical protein